MMQALGNEWLLGNEEVIDASRLRYYNSQQNNWGEPERAPHWSWCRSHVAGNVSIYVAGGSVSSPMFPRTRLLWRNIHVVRKNNIIQKLILSCLTKEPLLLNNWGQHSDQHWRHLNNTRVNFYKTRGLPENDDEQKSRPINERDAW